jgi:HSP20 family protein
MAHDREQEANRDDQSLRAPGRETEYVSPAVDIYETENAHVVLADLPGVSREGLEIHVEREHLTIRGRVNEGEPTSGKPAHREFRLRDYYRAFTLADEIDTDRIAASLADGVLRLELPKSSRARVRRIPVA